VVLDRRLKLQVVALSLVGIETRKFHHRLVEGILAAEIAAQHGGVGGPGVRPGKCRSADFGI
jgi:hypothetical protein